MNIHKLYFYKEKYISFKNNTFKQTVSFLSNNTQDRFEKQDPLPANNSQSTSTIPQLMKEVFTNNNPAIEEALANTDFSQFGKLGLPLIYSRKEFLSDLVNILKNLTEQEKVDILNKLNITLTNNNGTIEYNGIIDLSQLSSDDTEGEVLSIATKFIQKNSIQTNDEKLNRILNSLIQGISEFINIIGKQQENQAFSLDIQTLIALKEAIKNPEYQTLTNQDKFCLKLAIILLDITQTKSTDTQEHPLSSSLCAISILDKFKLPHEIKNRIYELIKNHHWFENQKKDFSYRLNIAPSFRRTNDFKIAQIITESSLKSQKTNGSFCKIPNKLKETTEMSINAMNYSGQIFLTSKIISPRKIPIVRHNGKEYKVINFTQLPNDFDLFQFGFAPGTTVENLRIWMHMIPDKKLDDLEAIYKLQKPNRETLLCASYGAVKNFKTFSNRLYGFSLDAEQVNIANASICDQNSNITTESFGKTTKRNFDRFARIIIGMDDKSEYRETIPESIMKTLELSPTEYLSLYAQIQKLKYASQLDNIPEIKVEDKVFSGKQIKEAILKANNLILSKKPMPLDCNEANIYMPKINAIVAKVTDLNDVPKQLLDFAQKYNFPIYLFGEN